MRNGLRLDPLGYRQLSAGVFPDSGRQSNVGMLAVGDGPPIGGVWGTIHGSCALAFSMFMGKSVVSWPTVGSADGSSATTSSLPSAAGATDKSTFVCWIGRRASNNSDGVLRLSLVVRLDLVRVEVPAKESGGSLVPPLSYQ